MIEFLIGLVAALVGGAFFYGRSTSKKNDLTAMRKAKSNHEKINQMDDDSQLAEFDRLREKRR